MNTIGKSPVLVRPKVKAIRIRGISRQKTTHTHVRATHAECVCTQTTQKKMKAIKKGADPYSIFHIYFSFFIQYLCVVNSTQWREEADVEAMIVG